jgi:hypothetical protein
MRVGGRNCPLAMRQSQKRRQLQLKLSGTLGRAPSLLGSAMSTKVRVGGRNCPPAKCQSQKRRQLQLEQTLDVYDEDASF